MSLESEIENMLIVNVPQKLEKEVLNKRGVVASFERNGLKIFIKAHPSKTNRLVVDHIEAGEDLVLRYVAKDTKDSEDILFVEE